MSKLENALQEQPMEQPMKQPMKQTMNRRQFLRFFAAAAALTGCGVGSGKDTKEGLPSSSIQDNYSQPEQNIIGREVEGVAGHRGYNTTKVIKVLDTKEIVYYEYQRGNLSLTIEESLLREFSEIFGDRNVFLEIFDKIAELSIALNDQPWEVVIDSDTYMSLGLPFVVEKHSNNNSVRVRFAQDLRGEYYLTVRRIDGLANKEADGKVYSFLAALALLQALKGPSGEILSVGDKHAGIPLIKRVYQDGLGINVEYGNLVADTGSFNVILEAYLAGQIVSSVADLSQISFTELHTKIARLHPDFAGRYNNNPQQVPYRNGFELLSWLMTVREDNPYHYIPLDNLIYFYRLGKNGGIQAFISSLIGLPEGSIKFEHYQACASAIYGVLYGDLSVQDFAQKLDEIRNLTQ